MDVLGSASRTTPGAVVVGAHINALGVVRALAARGVPIATISTRAYDVAQHSRWVSESHDLPEFHDRRESLVELLDHHRARWRGWVVFPTTDDALTTLSQHHERLASFYRLPVSPWETAADLVDKDRMHAFAETVGIDLPVCYGPADAAVKPARYPVVVKPIQHDRLISSFGAKLFLAESSDQLRAAVDRLNEAGLGGVVSDYVPGPDSNLYVYCVHIDARGEPSAGITVRKLRQDPPLIGGPRVVEIGTDVPGLREATVELLRRAGFRGMAFAEFKLDPRSGRFLFIEVNGRAVQLGGILPPTGVDLVGTTWADLVYDAPPRLRPTGWRGSWIHVEADIRCAVSHREVERLSLAELLAPYRGPKRFAVWSASDPGPYLAQTAHGMRGAAGRLARSRNGSGRRPASRRALRASPVAPAGSHPATGVVEPTKQVVYRLHQDAWSAWARHHFSEDIAGVERFCLFVGYPRSGHSILGALLNAHRDAVIAHELDAPPLIVGGCTREELYSRILARAYWFNMRGNQANYRYDVPGQWQGRFQTLRVIGDKRGGSVTQCLAEHPDFLGRVRRLVGVPLRLIHVVRNPFDNIGAISIWEDMSVAESVEFYVRHCQTTATLDQLCEPGELIGIHHEEMIRDPAAALSRLLRFLDLKPYPGYLEDCSRIVFAAPTSTRRRVPWPAELVRDVERRIEPYPFLDRYSFATDAPAGVARS